jgi:uncharacterized protein (TIGR02246 family)
MLRRAHFCLARFAILVSPYAPIMKRITILSVVCALLPLGPLLAEDASSETAIRAIVEEQAAAWNAGDGAGYSRHVSPDISFTNIFGTVMYGASAFIDRHTHILGTSFKGTTKRHTVRRVRFVTPDLALVDIDNEVHGIKAMPGGMPVPADGVLRSQLLEVFARRDGTWWVEAYHNVDVKPAAKPPGSKG